MNTKTLTDLLNAKIEIKQEPVKPMTADDYNKTMDTFVVKLNDMFKSLETNKEQEVKEPANNGEQQL